MNKIIDVRDIKNALWNHDKLVELANFLYKSRRNSINQRLFHNTLFTKYIQEYFASIVKVQNDLILKIYWEEFKLIRSQFAEAYISALQQIEDIKENIEEKLYNLLQKNDIYIDDNATLYHNYENYIIETKTKMINNVCKICYNNTISHVIVHDKHTCAICHMCVQKLNEMRTNSCPFCKINIQDYKKLIIS